MTKETSLINSKDIEINNPSSIKLSEKRSILFSHIDIGDIDRGGLCVLFKTLSSGLLKAGWDVHVVTTRSFKMEKINVHILPLKENPNKYSKQVTSIIKQIAPNIAESSNWRFELLDYSETNNRQTKIVVRADPAAGTLFDSLKNLEIWEKKLCQNADLILAVSEFSRKDIQDKYKIPYSDIHVVYNGINEHESLSNNKYLSSGEYFLPACSKTKSLKGIPVSEIIKPSMINIMWIGKPTNMKGFHLLERIVENAPENFNFIINIGYLTSEFGWRKSNYDKCFFVKDLIKGEQLLLLRNSDVFLSTSTVEGFGIAVAEALNVGLPVILNIDCEVYQEFLPNKGVILTNMKDMKNIINVILKSKDKKVNYSRLPSNFTKEKFIRQSIKFYKKLLKN
jgi:glycosyltransferase involved in cell wall biosynthesis